MSPVIGVGVLVERDDKVLIGERASGPWKGFWTLPGGKVELNETIEQCARRELFEETGLTAHGEIEFISVSREVCEARGLNCVTFGVGLRKFRGEVGNPEPDKFNTWQWAVLGDLPEKLFPPSISVLSTYLRKLNDARAKLIEVHSMEWAREVFKIGSKVE